MTPIASSTPFIIPFLSSPLIHSYSHFQVAIVNRILFLLTPLYILFHCFALLLTMICYSLIQIIIYNDLSIIHMIIFLINFIIFISYNITMKFRFIFVILVICLVNKPVKAGLFDGLSSWFGGLVDKALGKTIDHVK